MSGKGSAPRPFEVSQEQFASNWDAIFGEKKRTHFFVHDGWGKYYCKACGKKEDYSHHGETCPGEKHANTAV